MHSLPRTLIAGCLGKVDALLASVLHLAAPARCPACEREDDSADSLSRATPRLCAECATAAGLPPGERCPRCGGPIGPFADTAGGCVHCHRERFRFERVVRLGIYDGLLREMCLAAKHPQREDLATALAELLWEREERAFAALNADVVACVPHHWRDRLRGGPRFPEVVGRVLSRRLRVDFAPPILAKVRHTPKQAGLASSQRRQNLRGAFRVTRRFRSAVQGRRVLLIDDVLTTGATANECSRALLDAKAQSVVVAVIARGLGRKSTANQSG